MKKGERRGNKSRVYKANEYNQIQGLCTGSSDPDLWFSDTPPQLEGRRGYVPEPQKREMVARTIVALSICAICPSKQACLEEGMKPQNIDFGVWGGTLPGERLMNTNRSRTTSDIVNKVAFAKRVREAEKLLLTGERSS